MPSFHLANIPIGLLFGKELELIHILEWQFGAKYMGDLFNQLLCASNTAGFWKAY
jgi:hypothetical protein